VCTWRVDQNLFTFDASFADGKRKIFATMFIRNVTLDDDSLYGDLGSYECHGYVVGEANERARHGFSVSVIPSTICTIFSLYFHLEIENMYCVSIEF